MSETMSKTDFLSNYADAAYDDGLFLCLDDLEAWLDSHNETAIYAFSTYLDIVWEIT